MIPIFLALCLGLDLFVVGMTWYKKHSAVENVAYIAGVTGEIGQRMGPELDEAMAAFPEHPCRDALITSVAGKTDVYEGYDAAGMGENFLLSFGVTGPMADIIREKFVKFQSSVDKLAALDASMDMAAADITSELYPHLLITLCCLVTGEGLLFAMLLALYSMGSERVSRTEQMIYATRWGRTIQGSKWVASFLSALGSYMLLCLATMGAFAYLWRLGPIWGESVSSQFYVLPRFGYFLTWQPFSLAGYLAAELGLGLGLVAVFHGLAATSGLLAGDMYRGFLALFVLMAASVAGVRLAGDAGVWSLYAAGFFLPTLLWMDVGQWFTHGGIDTLFRGQELIVLGLWLILAGLLFFTAWRHFSRKDVA